MSLSPVPDPDDGPEPRQLSMFEGHRPTVFEMSLSGGTDLALTDGVQADLAEALKLGGQFTITITPNKKPDAAVVFSAAVQKRSVAKQRHREHGERVVSSARLSILGLAPG